MTALVARAKPARRMDGREGASPQWLIYYYGVQILCQLALLLSWLAPLRFLFRSSAYGMSLLALAFTAGQPRRFRHPAASLAILALVILALEAFHPETQSPLAALGTVAMYASIVGPLFWVPRLAMNATWFRRVVLTMWGFQSLSSLVGALQVFFPATFQPTVSTLLSDEYLSGLQITLSNGSHILRPSGLSDIPGGAAAAGTYAILLSIGLLGDARSRAFKLVICLSIALGMFALYICEIRSLVVMVAISILAMMGVHLSRGRLRQVGSVGILVGFIALASFIVAEAVGGQEVSRRLSTLIEGSPTDVYYSNRGVFLEATLTNLLPQYPLGAGLGRWGMLSSYFGVSLSAFIYVEIQWTGWLLDGGVPLVLTFIAALGVTFATALRIARGQDDSIEGRELASWGAMIVGYNVGTIALTFNFPAFMSNFGLDFWLLNAALLSVARSQQLETQRAAARPSPEAQRT